MTRMRSRKSKPRSAIRNVDPLGADPIFERLGFIKPASDISEAEARQIFAGRELDHLKTEFDRGINSAVLRAVNVCAEFGVLMPSWLRIAYMERFEKVERFEVSSWDDAFGRPFRKSVQTKDENKKVRLRFPVFDRVRELTDAGATLDDNTFDKVGREFGIGKTLCRQLYRSVKTLQIDATGRLAFLPHKPTRKTKRRP